MNNPFLFGGGLAFLAIGVLCCALFGVPIYFWMDDKRRRGEPVRVAPLIGLVLIGILGAAAALLFVLVRRW
jgi:hypothetical protein